MSKGDAEPFRSVRLVTLLSTLEKAGIPFNLRAAGDLEKIEVTGVAYDSRRLSRGNAFFAIRGERTDGHLYIKDVLNRGARAIFVQHFDPDWLGVDRERGFCVIEVPSTRKAMGIAAAAFYGDPSKNGLALIGVTGTNGKTTTASLLTSIVEAGGVRCGLIGTVEVRIGDRRLPSVRTTPEAPDLQKLLAEMLESGLKACAIEVSSHALALERVRGCSFKTAVFTNLSQDHLDFHHTMDSYFEAKASLFSKEYTASAAVNVSDEWGKRLLQRLEVPWVSFGKKEDGADVYAEDVVFGASSTSFVLHCKARADEVERGRAGDTKGAKNGGVSSGLLRSAGSHDKARVEIPLAGTFAVWNALAAAACATAMGIEFEHVLAGLEAAPPVPGRFEIVQKGQDFLAVVDYAHTPESVKAVLRSARALKGSETAKVIVVVGCGGDRDRAKRPLMGRAAVEEADFAVFTSDNPRSEDPQSILEQIVAGAEQAERPVGRFMTELDRRKAIHTAISMAGPGDVVVIAGKGHETGQIFKDETVPFDDREVVREALHALRGHQARPGSAQW